MLTTAPTGDMLLYSKSLEIIYDSYLAFYAILYHLLLPEPLIYCQLLCQLDRSQSHLGWGTLNWENTSIRFACGQVGGVCLSDGGEGLGPLWVVPPWQNIWNKIPLINSDY